MFGFGEFLPSLELDLGTEGAGVIEDNREADGAVEEAEVLHARDLMTAKECEVRGGPLGIVDEKSALFKPPLQISEGYLRGLGLPAEHAFAKKGTTDGDAIDAPDEPSPTPDFGAMSVAHFRDCLLTTPDASPQ